jgi:hypothetical protein
MEGRLGDTALMTFAALREIARKYEAELAVAKDDGENYVLVSKAPSPFPQHKGKPLDFLYVRIGKAYVSFHVLAISGAKSQISPELKKRMQGKTCFNFVRPPEPALCEELERLVGDGLRSWHTMKWL